MTGSGMLVIFVSFGLNTSSDFAGFPAGEPMVGVAVLATTIRPEGEEARHTRVSDERSNIHRL